MAFLDDADNSGTVTRNTLGFMTADSEVGFNQINSTVSAVMYYMKRDYTLIELDSPKFISGRCAAITVAGRQVGVFGEVHPIVLENWGIQMPTVVCELDLDLLRKDA